MLARLAAGASATPAEPPAVVHEALGSPGSPLDGPTRRFMETRFDHDFSHVRVHTGATAAESARQVGARAYTVGGSIVFGDGQYAPATGAGRRLLAHELAHTVQQGPGSALRLQRAEVDDNPRRCSGLTDIQPALDKHVNEELDAARKAAPGFDQDATKRRAFLQEVRTRTLEMENWVYWLSDASRPSGLSGTKYQGAAAVTPAPGNLAAVVKTLGFCVGSDKFGHFFDDGWSAFKAADRDAAKKAGTDDEIGIQGLGATGVFSNADIQANLAGRTFYEGLDGNPGKAFKIGDFIHKGWNERENPSYYTQGTGEVVWKNLLENGSWSGFVTFPGYRKELEISFTTADLSKLTVSGTYRERTIPDGSDPWNQTLEMGGKFSGDLKLKSTQVKGAAKQANAISGLTMDIVLDMDGGPDRTGDFASVGESQLTGSWKEDGSGGESGTWGLTRG